MAIAAPALVLWRGRRLRAGQQPIGTAAAGRLSGVRIWDLLSRSRLSAWVECVDIDYNPNRGHFPGSHSCRHGRPPHRLRVIARRRDNRAAWPRLQEWAAGSSGVLFFDSGPDWEK